MMAFIIEIATILESIDATDKCNLVVTMDYCFTLAARFIILLYNADFAGYRY